MLYLIKDLNDKSNLVSLNNYIELIFCLNTGNFLIYPLNLGTILIFDYLDDSKILFDDTYII